MHRVPSAEFIKHYEDMLRKDPNTAHLVDSWDGLPFPPQIIDPEFYMPIISREEWGALPPKPGATPLITPVMYVRYTWVGDDECYSVEECSAFLRNLQESSMEKGLVDLPYNFLIGGKGLIYEGRGWEWEADRDEKYNEKEGLFGKLKGKTVDVAYIGDISFYVPSNEACQAAVHFVKLNNKRGLIDDMVEIIPYKDRDADYRSPLTYYTVEDIEKEANKSKNKKHHV